MRLRFAAVSSLLLAALAIAVLVFLWPGGSQPAFSRNGWGPVVLLLAAEDVPAERLPLNQSTAAQLNVKRVISFEQMQADFNYDVRAC